MKRGNPEFGFPLHHVLIVAGGIKQKEATAGALVETIECTWTSKHGHSYTVELVNYVIST